MLHLYELDAYFECEKSEKMHGKRCALVKPGTFKGIKVPGTFKGIKVPGWSVFSC